MEEEISIPVLFGKNVQKYRKLAGLTQADFSKRLEITQKHLSIIETGTQFASAALISRISKELNVPPAALFGQDMNQEYFDNLYSSIDALVENKLKLFQDSLSLDIETKLNQKVSIILNNLMNH